MEFDVERLSLTDIIRLQTRLNEAVKRRFERTLALVFTDVAGSTTYFARFGDVAGRQLQQRHLDLLAKTLVAAGGRVVDIAGDGAFSCFADVESATTSVLALAEAASAQNATVGYDHQLHLRMGVHWGHVLTDGTVVTGDAVNLCARVMGTCDPGEIRLTQGVFRELSRELRLLCRPLPPAQLKGIADAVSLMRLETRDRNRFPQLLKIVSTLR